jgi:hypothetical protein
MSIQYSPQSVITPADLSTSAERTTADFAENTAVLATDSNPAIASHKLQTNLHIIQNDLEMENEN